jgi:hypothetical protein
LGSHPPERLILKRVLTLVLAAVALAAMCAPALAGKGQLSIFQDDAVLRGSGDEARDKALAELDGLGVDVVKMNVNWRTLAPAGDRKPEGFDGANPASYSADAWAPYDDFVQRARARGLRVLFALGGLAPDWASSGTEHSPGSKKPHLGEYRKFVMALGRRYSGSYAVGGSSPGPAPPEDPEMPLPLPRQASAAQAGTTLPRVGLWTVWNEPNLAAWLAPQRRGGTPFAPHYYRRMVNGAKSGLAASGHGRDTMLIGELLPYGASKVRIRPLEFLREMACVDRRFRPFRGKAARKRGCRGFKALPGAGFAFHPYTLAGGPNVKTSHRDEVTIAYLHRLVKTLNRLGAKKRLKRHRMPVWITEFAFQTDPPDPFQSAIAKVPGFMGLSEWLTWRNPRVASHAQYLLYDDKASGSGFSRYAGFQSGIRFANGKAKPGVYSAYRLPFFVRRRGSRKVEVWGGVRAAGEGRSVTVQSRRGKKWKKLGTARTAKRGYFRKTFRVSSPAKRMYRFRAGSRSSVQLRAVRR